MDRKTAKDIRGKKFSELMTEKLLGEQGVSQAFRNTLSERSKARSVAMKDKFDPMNIAKALTGGSKLAPALVGRMMGRSQEDIEHFAGTSKKKGKQLGEGELNIHKKFQFDKNDSSTEVLGLIYRLMLRTQIEEQERLLEEQKKQKDEKVFEDTRNNELIKALTARRKPPTRKQKEAERRKERKEEKKAPKEEKKTPPSKEEKKAPSPKVEKAPPKEVSKAPEKLPSKEVPKEPVKPPPKAEAPAPKPPSAAKVPPVAIAGNKGLVISALVAAGLSTAAQSNILANVDKESNFNPRSEELPGAEKIYAMFGGPEVGKTKDGRPLNKSGNVIRFPAMEDVKNTLAKGPEDYFNKVYDGRMGNNAQGDGYKYRGRGFIQITGKDMYQRIGKMIGIDLVKDPDLANQPEIAAKIIPAFFQLKIKERKGNISDLENIDTVNSTVGSADVKSKEARKVLAEKYKSELGVPSNQALPSSLTPTTGTKIDQSSKENKQLKDKSKDNSAMSVNNNTTITNKSSSSSSTSKPQGDDTNAYQQKVQR